jgi:protein farnesyltransferase/geranylgeranyltransferase type-1 subunit alpha
VLCLCKWLAIVLLWWLKEAWSRQAAELRKHDSLHPTIMVFNFIRDWLRTIFLSPYNLLRELLPEGTNFFGTEIEMPPKFYHDDEAWADIVPLPQDDGGLHPLAAIAYSDEYSEAMDYLRAVMAKNEFSERVLRLTDHIISMNPAHYTVW